MLNGGMSKQHVQLLVSPFKWESAVCEEVYQIEVNIEL